MMDVPSRDYCSISCPRNELLTAKIAELEAENSELTTWWKFEEACKNRACSKELDYIERITALESAIAIHMREETMLEFHLDDVTTDADAISKFLHDAAELEPDLSIANPLWKQAALLGVQK